MSTLDPVLTAATAVGTGVVGLAVGSFLNVVVHRVPLGESVVRPASRCPGCRSEISARDNVPVLSWLLLRGRCRICAEPISARYPLVELLTGLLFAAVGVVVGPTWALPAYLYLAALAVSLAAIDLDVHRLPDAIVKPAWIVTPLLLAIASAGTGEWAALGRAGVGALALGGLYVVLFVVKPGGMGFGDVKLAPVLGAFLGWWSWEALAVGSFAAFALGGVIAVVVIAKGGGRTTKVPFGPSMLTGALLALVVAGPVAGWYLGFMGIAPSA